MENGILNPIGWDEMIMAMWYFISDKGGTYPIASCDFFKYFRDFFGSYENSRIIWLWHIAEVIHLTLWHDERMTSLLREDIEKSIDIFILIYLE